jgi:hypothetical protein
VLACLAVHCSISLNDAIAVGLTGERSKHQEHAHASHELEKLCTANKVADKKGVQHLNWLFARKADFAYGEKRLDEKNLLLAKDQAERFQAWAYNTFKGVLRG